MAFIVELGELIAGTMPEPLLGGKVKRLETAVNSVRSRFEGVSAALSQIN
jgi:hypothetical protein